VIERPKIELPPAGTSRPPNTFPVALSRPITGVPPYPGCVLASTETGSESDGNGPLVIEIV
jgi:hypothetical protein